MTSTVMLIAQQCFFYVICSKILVVKAMKFKCKGHMVQHQVNILSNSILHIPRNFD